MMQPVLFFSAVVLTLALQSQCESFIDNFQQSHDLSGWVEHSDTMMKNGKSKASFVLHSKNGQFRRAVLFTLLDPQSCGAAIAGIRKSVMLDIHKYKTISMKIRGQGQYRGYEFFLRHRGDTGKEVPSYVHYFQAPSEFKVVTLALKHFKPQLKGVSVDNAEPLDTSYITTLGILAYGGAHLPRKQHGVAVLEIDWIKLE